MMMKRKKTKSNPAFLNLNKPAGMSSFDCLRSLKRITGIRKMGHLGTLDPAAVGVLPVALEDATRLIPYVEKEFKIYRAKILLGITTKTDDLDGEIIEENEVSAFRKDEIENALTGFLGDILQVPPSVSAVHINGVRAYKLAREGKEFDIEPRQVKIHSIDILQYNHPELTIDVTVGGGTYIRSIARDLGKILGCGAALSHLTRLQDGSFRLDDSHTPDEVKQAVEEGRLESLLLPPGKVLENLISVVVNSMGIEEISHGRPVEKDGIEPGFLEMIDFNKDGKYCLLDHDDCFLAIARTNAGDGKLLMEKVFVSE